MKISELEKRFGQNVREFPEPNQVIGFSPLKNLGCKCTMQEIREGRKYVLCPVHGDPERVKEYEAARSRSRGVLSYPPQLPTTQTGTNQVTIFRPDSSSPSGYSVETKEVEQLTKKVDGHLGGSESDSLEQTLVDWYGEGYYYSY